MNNNIEDKLKNIKAKSLSQVEKNTLWQSISGGMNKNDNLSIFNLILSKKSVVNMIIALVLIFGGSIATVQAADKAKPGDTLYGIDRAVENIKITFASSENKDKLKIKFAEERLFEIQSVIEDEVGQNEALDIEQIEKSTNVALEYITRVRNELFAKDNQVATAALDDVIERLQDKFADLSEDLEIDLEIEEDGTKAEFKLEFKSENGKFKIKYKSEDDGDIKIELEDRSKEKDHNKDRSEDDDEDKKDHDKDDDSDENNIDKVEVLKEIEVKIFSNKTEVKGESANDKKFKFILKLTSQAEIIAAIAERFGVTAEEVEAVVRFEIKDKDRGEDKNKDEDDDEDDNDNTTSTEDII